MVALLKNIPIVSEKWMIDSIQKKEFLKNYEDY